MARKIDWRLVRFSVGSTLVGLFGGIILVLAILLRLGVLDVGLQPMILRPLIIVPQAVPAPSVTPSSERPERPFVYEAGDGTQPFQG